MRTRVVIVLLAAMLPSAWLGCNAILGIDEARFVPEAGATGDDGPATDSPLGDDGPSADADGGTDADADAITCDADFANDPQNCGACAHDCLGGSCEGGTCGAVLLVRDTVPIKVAAVDSTSLYFIDSHEEVRRVPLIGGDGGLGELLYAVPAPAFADGIASTGTDVYFGVAELGDGGAIERCPVAGCAAPPTAIASVVSPNRILVSGGSLFWNDDQNDGGVSSCTLPSCTTITTLATQQRFPSALAVDATEVFWSSAIGGYVHAAPVGGGMAPRSLTEATPNAFGVGVSGDKVFTSKLSTGIDVIPRAGGAPTTFTTVAAQAQDVAADPAFVFFGDYLSGTIYRCPRDGCASVTVLASSQGSPKRVVLDATSLVWIEDGSGPNPPAIWRIAR